MGINNYFSSVIYRRHSCRSNGRIDEGGGIYVASQVTWYPGLALLGPEIVQKSKDIWNNLKNKIKGLFK